MGAALILFYKIGSENKGQQIEVLWTRTHKCPKFMLG